MRKSTARGAKENLVAESCTCSGEIEMRGFDPEYWILPSQNLSRSSLFAKMWELIIILIFPKSDQ